MASPLYTAPDPELSTAMIAYLPAFAGSNPGGFTAGFHPRTVPSSVANRKRAGALVGIPPPVTPDIMNACWADAMLKTRPVGAPPAPNGSPGAGIETIRA